MARAALTLIYPGRDELADRLPTAPLADENILIFTESRGLRECATCDLTPAILPTALQEIMLRLYGPGGTGQIAANRIRSFTFGDLNQLLTGFSGQDAELERAIASARWIIFAPLDYNPDDYYESAALRNFLARRSDSLRDKRLVVLAFNAPYYLDTTEVSKLTAFFGVYARTSPFLETAVRGALSRVQPGGRIPGDDPWHQLRTDQAGRAGAQPDHLPGAGGAGARFGQSARPASRSAAASNSRPA